MNAVLSPFPFVLWSCFRTRASMHLEILALRHQLAVLQRRCAYQKPIQPVNRWKFVVWGLTSHSHESRPIVVPFDSALVLPNTSKYAPRNSCAASSACCAGATDEQVS